MLQRLQDPQYSFISDTDKAFIAAFDQAIGAIGYTSNGEIGPGFCWGRAMVIYVKRGVKAKQVAARIYIRDDNIALRLFLNGIDRHRDYLEHARISSRLLLSATRGPASTATTSGTARAAFEKPIHCTAAGSKSATGWSSPMSGRFWTSCRTTWPCCGNSTDRKSRWADGNDRKGFMLFRKYSK